MAVLVGTGVAVGGSVAVDNGVAIICGSAVTVGAGIAVGSTGVFVGSDVLVGCSSAADTVAGTDVYVGEGISVVCTGVNVSVGSTTAAERAGSSAGAAFGATMFASVPQNVSATKPITPYSSHRPHPPRLLPFVPVGAWSFLRRPLLLLITSERYSPVPGMLWLNVTRFVWLTLTRPNGPPTDTPTPLFDTFR